MARAAILDIDGTLVDTNYQHAIAWWRALHQHGFTVPTWRIHRAIGMGGDKLLPHLIGEDAAAEHGDDVRAAESALYKALMPEVVPLEGARELIADLKGAGRTVVLASSAKAEEAEHYIDLLDARDLADCWTTSAEVEETKPAPDLVQAALEKAGTEDAVMVGDTPWDVEAAEGASVPTVAVMTGGFARAELEESGAVAVFESIEELRDRIGETPLA